MLKAAALNLGVIPGTHAVFHALTGWKGIRAENNEKRHESSHHGRAEGANALCFFPAPAALAILHQLAVPILLKCTLAGVTSSLSDNAR